MTLGTRPQPLTCTAKVAGHICKPVSILFQVYHPSMLSMVSLLPKSRYLQSEVFPFQSEI